LKKRHSVLSFLVALAIITFLDRISISVAAPHIQEELHIGAAEWGWVIGAFVLAYGLFEIPAGALGDRMGPRAMLTRIVLWWSAFTALTGAVDGISQPTGGALPLRRWGGGRLSDHFDRAGPVVSSDAARTGAGIHLGCKPFGRSFGPAGGGADASGAGMGGGRS